MFKEKMYVRCPLDIEYPDMPRVFVCGKIEKIDEFKGTAIVNVQDPFKNIQFFEKLKSGLLEYYLNDLERCSLFKNSIVIYHKHKYKVLALEKKNEFYNYYLQNIKTKCIESVLETEIVAAFNNGRVDPCVQLKNYEFQNPAWFLGRNIVSKNVNILNNSIYGFKELAGSKIFLLPHQVNTIMRCLQDSPSRYMLADEVGMGKTIEAISILKIFLLNKTKQKVLIIVPDGLGEQWKSELLFKFNITIGENESNHVYLKKYSQVDIQDLLIIWDYVIIDEVHTSLNDSKYYDIFYKISLNSRNLLLLSATPVQDKVEDYLKLLCLLSPKKYSGYDLNKFSGLILKQNKIIQKVSMVLDDLEDYQNIIFECKENGFNPREDEDCIDLFDEMQADLEDICYSFHDENLHDMFEHIDFNEEDLGVYSIKVLLAFISGNYQIESNIIRNRRKILESREDEESLLPKRELIEIPYSLEENGNSYETLIYSLLIEYIENNVEKTEKNIHDVIKPLFSAFFSSSKAFLNVAKKILDDCDETSEIIYNAERWYDHEIYIVEHIKEILDDPDMYESLYSTRIVQVCNSIYDECYGSKTVIFTDFDETLIMYKKALSKLFNVYEYSSFCRLNCSIDNELNAYKFQNEDNCKYMLCDYTGGEGRNFQCADYIIHIDLPWNANAIEQRIGRLDRLERDKSRNIVTSIVPYISGTFEEALFKFWDEGLKIFTQSLSGMEIIMQDINQEIYGALQEDFQYGLIDHIDKIIVKVEKMRKDIEKEQRYDTASAIYRPLYKELSKLINYYNNSESTIFANTMATWASLAGFRGHYLKNGIVSYSASLFSLNSALNSFLIPPDWSVYQTDRKNIFLSEIEEKYNKKEKKQVQNRVIKGTFNRKKAIENDYIHFFAPGDPIFDCIVDNAINSCKGQVSAFEIKMEEINWTGFVFTWDIDINTIELIENGISIRELGLYKTFVASEQITIPISIENPQDLDYGTIKKIVNNLLNDDFKKTKNNVKHLGKRSDSKKMLEFKSMYPKEMWTNLIDEAKIESKKIAIKHLSKSFNLKGAQEEMERALSAKLANIIFYNSDFEEYQKLLKKQEIISQVLKKASLKLESVAFVRMRSNDD